jgi:dihydrolipoamide dehydrogenase
MYTPEQSAQPLMTAMHIHPALSEVVSRAFASLVPPKEYHHILEEHFGLSAT